MGNNLYIYSKQNFSGGKFSGQEQVPVIQPKENALPTETVNNLHKKWPQKIISYYCLNFFYCKSDNTKLDYFFKEWSTSWTVTSFSVSQTKTTVHHVYLSNVIRSKKKKTTKIYLLWPYTVLQMSSLKIIYQIELEDKHFNMSSPKVFTWHIQNIL